MNQSRAPAALNEHEHLVTSEDREPRVFEELRNYWEGEGRAAAARASRESQREAVFRLMMPLLTALLSSLSTVLT